MSEFITFTRNHTLSLVDSMLRDENGISEDTYDALCQMFVATGNMDLWHEISLRVEATDGRFYIPEDVECETPADHNDHLDDGENAVERCS